MNEEKAYQYYNDYLDELFPLEGINCNPFSILLKEGDPIAYDCGFNDFCDANCIELK